MSDYTPTTEEVRADYCGTWAFRNSRAEFDRWLAEVKAQAWEEGWSSGYKFHAAIWEPTNQPKKINPYRGENK